MSNPWDPFPFPAMGDQDFDTTYAGVGAALSQWEAIEFALARLYSIFANDSDGNSLREFGTGRIFRDRIVAITAKAETYFRKHPSQDNEGETGRLVDHAIRFSDRRNEVAHGIVMDVRHITHFQSRMPLMKAETPHYILVPPWHTLRKHDAQGFPSYAYNGLQLKNLAARLHAIERSASAFRRTLLGLPPKP